MDNENGHERDHPQQQQSNAPVPAPAVQTTARLATGPGPGPVVPPIVTPSPGGTGYQAPSQPPPTTSSPIAIARPVSSPQAAPVSSTSPRALVPPQTTTSARPFTSPYPPPPLSRYTEVVDGDRRSASNPDHGHREAGYGHDDGRDEYGNPLPPVPIALPTAADIRVPPRSKTAESYLAGRPRSEVDHVVPYVEKPLRRSSVAERLEPTIAKASAERAKFAWKAKMTGHALNAAIGLQVLLGSLTTGLSAATTSGKQAALATTILGGLSTLVAGYLARSRGSNEPELSIHRVKDLDQFVRKCEAFKLDFGHVTSSEYDEVVYSLRLEFEELLGNASGERKLAPPV